MIVETNHQGTELNNMISINSHEYIKTKTMSSQKAHIDVYVNGKMYGMYS